MPLILGANSVSGYTVKNSLRFNSASSDYLSRTPSSTGDRQKFTISCWVKRSTLTASGKNIMVAWDTAKGSASFGSAIYFNSSDQIEVDHDIAGSDYTFNTNMVFRDVSAWYHIVLAVDTTQATSANRQTIYVNGSSVALTATALGFPIQNFNTFFNFSGGENDIGSNYFTAGYADQYMSEFYLIDGQALTPSSFGETDFDTGIWKPKAYTGSFGTNGFYLQFKNSASLGTDSSGNGNTFTVNNLTSIDQTTDTPTNNFATLNPLIKFQNPSSYSNGNNTVTGGGSGSGDSPSSSIAVSKGKWYVEVKITSTDSGGEAVGIIDIDKWNPNANADEWFYKYSYGYGYKNANGDKITNNSGSSYGSSYTDGDIIGIALDLDNNYLYFSKNGVFQNSGVPTSGATGTGSAFNVANGNYVFSFYHYYSHVLSTNFGNPPYSANSYTDGAGYGNFSYAVPSGYYALNTKNLATFG
jgi:hypothetical protein